MSLSLVRVFFDTMKAEFQTVTPPLRTIQRQGITPEELVSMPAAKLPAVFYRRSPGGGRYAAAFRGELRPQMLVNVTGVVRVEATPSPDTVAEALDDLNQRIENALLDETRLQARLYLAMNGKAGQWDVEPATLAEMHDELAPPYGAFTVQILATLAYLPGGL